ncbi:putative lipid II flippase FtsW [Oceanidesulfovibrio marinus]|uniref:Probable peptidoglycan glycosyltransferase FtsW n=1 Tax=Oceanidesulfovibrio marinus TaxID=370038 RepID=A0A6P1ZQC7_9BACT|nr:putative lipid II flippase FtsW [Oceanidesulfovibrio marinus]TVM36715.1 putative lipid II flippase FtsW [Oceanidesulfovibrio marinus]
MRAPTRQEFREILAGFDFWLLLATVLMAVFGLVMVLSASGIMAEKYFGGVYYFFVRQLACCVVGAGLMVFLALAPQQLFLKTHYLLLGIACALLLTALFTPLGVEVNGARRWISLGITRIQPMEFAKIALVLYLAWFLSHKKDLVRTFSVGVVPPFAVTGLFGVLLLMQPDFGGAAMLAMLLFLMCLAGGTRLVYLFMSVSMAAGGAFLLIVNSPYRSRRLLAFLDPFKDAMDTGYQLVQSLYSFGAGGFWGVGLGAGKQKLFFLPEAHNDFIVAVIGEELGFAGLSLLFFLVAILLWRGFNVAVKQEDLHRRLVAYGMTLILGLGAILNMAVVLGVAPPKGVPMPFVSYGGSSLLASFVCAGILLNLSRETDPVVRRAAVGGAA